MSLVNPEAEVCTAFEKITNAQLSVFDEEIESKTLIQLPCHNELISRLNTYYEQQKIELYTHLLSLQNTGVGLESVGTPSEKLFGGFVYVDTDNTVEVSNLALPKGEILLSFDDGPHPTRSALIEDILAKYGVRSNFFAVGNNLKDKSWAYTTLNNAVHNLGFIYGSHSMTHTDPLDKMPFAQAQAEINNGHFYMVDATQVDSRFFRFPYGARNAQLKAYLGSIGMTSFLWTMDSLDWQIKNTTDLYANVVKELNREKRGIMLFHDIHQQTVDILEPLLADLQNAGYTIKLAVPLKWKDKYQ